MPDRQSEDAGTCRSCGENYPRLVGEECLRCRVGAQAERRRLSALCDFVRSRPHVTVAEASTATGVSPAKINELIAEGRLVAKAR